MFQSTHPFIKLSIIKLYAKMSIMFGMTGKTSRERFKLDLNAHINVATTFVE